MSAHFNFQRKLRKRRHSSAPKASTSLPVKHNLLQIRVSSDVTSLLPVRSLAKWLCYRRGSVPPTFQFEFTHSITGELNSALLPTTYINLVLFILTITIIHTNFKKNFVLETWQGRLGQKVSTDYTCCCFTTLFQV